MTHLDDGTLQSFLDDELPPGERAEAAEHLLACSRCRAAQEELLRAHALFSHSVAVLDVEPAFSPTRRSGSRARRGTSSVVKAAGLILALAAAASAAVPGSPVRAWIESAIEPEAPAAPTPAPDRTPALAPTELPAPAGVSLSADGPVVVALVGVEGTAILLEASDGASASVSARGCVRDPVFRTGRDRIEVREAAGGQVRVRLPARSGARLEVNGRLYAEARQGALRVHVPGDTIDGAIVWR